MTSNAVTVHLNVAVAGSHPVAELDFFNGTSVRAGLVKLNACIGGRIDNNVFRIVGDGTRLDYTGIMAKRRPPGPDDYAWLEPGQGLKVTVRLDEAYAFLEGQRAYVAVYSAFHQQPDGAPLLKLESNEFTFTLKK